MSLADLIPVSEQCTRRVIDLLSAITRENGFANDATVERAEEDGNPKGVQDASLQIVVEEIGLDDATTDGSTPIGLDGYRLTLNVGYFVLSTTADDDVPIGLAMAQAHADIRKAIDADRQLNGLAVNTDIGAPDMSWNAGKIPAAILPLTVLFWTKRYDPYTLPGA